MTENKNEEFVSLDEIVKRLPVEPHHMLNWLRVGSIKPNKDRKYRLREVVDLAAREGLLGSLV